MVWAADAILTQASLRADTIVYAGTNGSGIIGTLDLNTGVFTQIAAPGLSLSSVSGLGEYGGVLSGASRGLFQLNPVTGAVSSAPTTFSQNGNNFDAEIGFGSTAVGLFAVGTAFGGLNSLYSIDRATGTPTPIGSTGVTAGGGTGFLAASTDSGPLYWEVQNGCTDTLYSLNTSTGAATLIGTAAACFPSKTGNRFAMVFTGGTLWANF